jgi:Uma2 family endonuclease
MIPFEGVQPERRAAMSVQIARRYFTVDEYHRMGEAGIFSEDDRVELIEGEILNMTPIGSRHAGTVNRLSSHLYDFLGKRAIVAVQNPILLNDLSEPQPDIAILKPRADFYTQSLPAPADVFVVIEIADTSLAYDRDIKLPAYARSTILEVWIVDLDAQAVAVHTNPINDVYRNVRSYRRGETITPVQFPALSIRVDDILA